jgi:hypothetical protein
VPHGSMASAAGDETGLCSASTIVEAMVWVSSCCCCGEAMFGYQLSLTKKTHVEIVAAAGVVVPPTRRAAR